MTSTLVHDFAAEVRRLRADPAAGRIDFSGRDITGQRLEGLDLSKCNLSGCDFSDAQIVDCDFSGSNLAGTMFQRAHVSGSRFHSAEMSGVDLEGADFSGADFTDANLSGSDLRKTTLRGATLSGANLGGADFLLTVMPDGSVYEPQLHGETIVRQSSTGRRLKILLTMPTWTDNLGAFSKIGRIRNPQIPLGLLYLGTIAETHGHQVQFIDCDVEDVAVEDLTRRAIEGGFDLIGLSATSPIFHKAVLAADQIKKASGSKIKIIIGGDHVNIFGASVFFDCFDFLAIGEAEETWPEFLRAFAEGATDYSAIDGLAWRRDGKAVCNKPRRTFPDLDKLPMPAVHLSKMEQYRMSFALWKNRNIGKYVSIMMSRGCPFKCSFCSESSDVKYGGEVAKMRYRSAINIVDEIEAHYRNYGVKHFFFMDSNITLKKKHTVDFCNEIIKRKLPITFEGWTRANLINDEIMELLTKAGLVRLSCGVESGDPEVLKIIKKDVPQEATREFFRLCKKYGVEAMCSAMLGSPGETKASVERTIRFLDSIPELLFTNFSIANPYPGTEMLKWAREGKHGLRLRYDELSKYTRYDDSPIEVNDLTAKDLVRYQALGLIKIHLRPHRFIAAIRMLGFAPLVPIFFKMAFKVAKGGSEMLGTAFSMFRADKGHADLSPIKSS